MNQLAESTLTLDSREVAKMLPKRHDHLIRDIATYCGYFNAPKIGAVDFFRENSYLDSKGERRKNYLITKKGCEFLAHKMTGKKGALFTATYINRFHEMEKALQNGRVPAVYEFIPRTYQGERIMTTADVAALTGMKARSILYFARRHKVSYRILHDEEVNVLRRENPDQFTWVSMLAIFTGDEVKQLLRAAGILARSVWQRVHDYFSVAVVKKERPLVVDANDRKWNASITDLKDKVTTLRILLDTVAGYERVEDNQGRRKIIKELSAGIFADICEMNRYVDKLPPIPAPAGSII